MVSQTGPALGSGPVGEPASERLLEPESGPGLGLELRPGPVLGPGLVLGPEAELGPELELERELERELEVSMLIRLRWKLFHLRDVRTE